MNIVYLITCLEAFTNQLLERLFSFHSSLYTLRNFGEKGRYAVKTKLPPDPPDSAFKILRPQFRRTKAVRQPNLRASSSSFTPPHPGDRGVEFRGVVCPPGSSTPSFYFTRSARSSPALTPLRGCILL